MSFKRLEEQDFLVSADSITSTCWSDNRITLTSFFTSSAQADSTSGDYFLDVYDGNPSTSTSASVQFSIAYGDTDGSGSVRFNTEVSSSTPSRTIYGQYRNLILGDEEDTFTFGSGDNLYTSKNFLAVSLDRSRYKEKISAGSFQLSLTNSTDSITLTDTSTTTTTQTFTDAGRVFELKSNVSSSVANSGSYGKLLPDIGVAILNIEALNAPVSEGGLNLGITRTDNTDNQALSTLFESIAAGGDFKCRSSETITSNFVFVRARNNEFNYTTNPSFLTGSGEIRQTELIDTPQTYVTTVGLYNDNNDLLAVAKLSRPLLKDFTKEALVRIKLDY